MGVEKASVLFKAVGEVGESVQDVHHFLKGSYGSMLTRLVSVIAGLKGATTVLKGRFQKNRERYPNGEQAAAPPYSNNSPRSAKI